MGSECTDIYVVIWNYGTWLHLEWQIGEGKKIQQLHILIALGAFALFHIAAVLSAVHHINHTLPEVEDWTHSYSTVTNTYITIQYSFTYETQNKTFPNFHLKISFNIVKNIKG